MSKSGRRLGREDGTGEQGWTGGGGKLEKSTIRTWMTLTGEKGMKGRRGREEGRTKEGGGGAEDDPKWNVGLWREEGGWKLRETEQSRAENKEDRGFVDGTVRRKVGTGKWR